MSVRVLAIGKKHEAWVVDGIDRYERRLKKPYDLSWRLLPHSARQEEAARTEESDRILGAVAPVTMVIGGAYGVDARVHARADRVWSLSPLVFPHQLVRLILAEQVYRAQEISAGRPYHHA